MPKTYETIAKIYANYPADLPLTGEEKVEVEQGGNSKACKVLDLLNYGSVVGLLDGQTLLDKDNWSTLLLATCKPFTPEPFSLSLCARIQTPIDSGTADSDVAMKLIDSGASWIGLVVAGDIVYNHDDNTYATVLLVINNTTLWLDWDCFPDGNEQYSIFRITLPDQIIKRTGALIDGDGTAAADTDTANHLIDADGSIWNTGLVSVGDWVMNLNTGLVAYVIAGGVAAHDLTLNWDCFPNGDEPYAIFADLIEITDADSPLFGEFLHDMNISNRIIGAGLSSERVLLDTTQPYWHAVSSASNNWGDAANGNPTGGANRLTSSQNTLKAKTAETDGTHGEPRLGPWTTQKRIEQVIITRIK
jgi:hypothetical protein